MFTTLLKKELSSPVWDTAHVRGEKTSALNDLPQLNSTQRLFFVNLVLIEAY